MSHPDATPATQPRDLQALRAWSAPIFASAATLPIAFRLDGESIRGIPADWQPTRTRRRIDANIVETEYTGTHPATGLTLTVNLTEYLDYPVIEWVAWFSQRGAAPTPILSEIQALDAVFEGSAPVLWHCNGDFYSAEGYTPTETPLAAGARFDASPNGGRSCDGAFPYYRLSFAEWGLCLAIGWPAQWAAAFCGLADGVRVCAGQQHTHLRLAPGECIRTPRMTLLAWGGDAARAVNLWRRWYLAHVLPRPDGQPLRPLLACAGTDEGEEFTAATEANQIGYLQRWHSYGIRPDVWWIDAGWYPCRNPDGERRWWITGSWEPDPERFPQGLKPISVNATRHDVSLLVWFEPERVQPGTRLATEHPEWLLRVPDNDNALLNLGDAACRQWLTDHVCALITDNGIRIYRQDHNFAPLEHWHRNEPEDRQGMNENLHVQGYLRYWDDLLARNPGLWIDSCASGGRRNDLETMRRSVPLHYSDWGYGFHPDKLSFHRTLFEWIPYFKESTLSWDTPAGPQRYNDTVDSFSFHCSLAAMLSPGLDIRRDDYDYALAARLIALWRRAADLLLYGDYYPLTRHHRSAEEWVAWQFDAPERGCGVVQAIRLAQAPQEAITLRPQAVDRDATYLFENPESGESRRMSGAALERDGLTLAQPQRSGALWFYRKIDAS